MPDWASFLNGRPHYPEKPKPDTRQKSKDKAEIEKTRVQPYFNTLYPDL